MPEAVRLPAVREAGGGMRRNYPLDTRRRHAGLVALLRRHPWARHYGLPAALLDTITWGA